MTTEREVLTELSSYPNPLDLPLSKLRAEWNRIGFIPTKKPTCELCGQQNLRYNFLIYNQFTNQSLIVGSSCIEKFVTALFGQGTRVFFENGSECTRANLEPFLKQSKSKIKQIWEKEERARINAIYLREQREKEWREREEVRKRQRAILEKVREEKAAEKQRMAHDLTRKVLAVHRNGLTQKMFVNAEFASRKKFAPKYRTPEEIVELCRTNGELNQFTFSFVD